MKLSREAEISSPPVPLANSFPSSLLAFALISSSQRLQARLFSAITPFSLPLKGLSFTLSQSHHHSVSLSKQSNVSTFPIIALAFTDFLTVPHAHTFVQHPNDMVSFSSH